MTTFVLFDCAPFLDCALLRLGHFTRTHTHISKPAVPHNRNHDHNQNLNKQLKHNNHNHNDTHAQAVDQFETCLKTTRFRFRRCTVASVRPHNLCDGTSYPVTATFTIDADLSAGARKVNVMGTSQLNLLASKLAIAAQDECGLNVRK